MNSTSGEGSGKGSFSARDQRKVQSTERCSFCWFVLASYPDLKGMTERDTETYREHLRKAHGLTSDIQP